MCNILLVEDHDETREAFTRSLESYGHHVEPTTDGVEALGRLAKGAPALPCIILLDLRLPQMDGWDFLRVLQAEPAWVSIPVIVVSSMVKDHAPNPVLRAEAFWSKPPDADRLIS